ncbi:hypothetical protein ON010_g9487 [Phytophthora cinnamomi]|nr:hypothetical protein ON010_g9487 [Phytophthora cinnamomi]
MVTAYDYPSAVHVDLAGFDILLVGDSLGMVELVRAAAATDWRVGVSEVLTLASVAGYGHDASRDAGGHDPPHAGGEAEGGADCVKIEGGKERADTTAQARMIIEDALAVQKAGAFAVLIECVPSAVAKAVTELLKVPTIGIGAGPETDGQVLVFHDLLGMLQHPHHAQFVPKFCKRYAHVGEQIRLGLEAYRDDVEKGRFPSETYSPYKMSKDETQKLHDVIASEYRHEINHEDDDIAPSEIAKVIDYEDWETDEPPVLGEADKLNNQVVVESVKLQGESIMDEMVAVAQRAKEDKRKQQDRERNHKSFGRGLKKGFFNTAKPARTKKAATAKSASILEPIQQQSRHDRLLIVKEQKEEAAATANPTFVFPEVQEAMKSMNQLDPKEWMNARFFEKLARNPKLAQALQNPAFTNAIAEMQQDPHAAILKYQKDPAVSKMLRDFMEFLGSHFEELGSSEGSASSQRPSVKQQQQFEEDPLVENNQPSTASTPASKTPAIVDLDETRRQAIAGMQRTPEEEEQVQRISKNPELLAALSDGSLMQRLHACQQSPGELQRLAQDPVLGPKLRLLVQHNMVQICSAGTRIIGGSRREDGGAQGPGRGGDDALPGAAGRGASAGDAAADVRAAGQRERHGEEGAGPAGRRGQGLQARGPRAAQAGRGRGQEQRQQAPRVHQQRAVRRWRARVNRSGADSFGSLLLLRAGARSTPRSRPRRRRPSVSGPTYAASTGGVASGSAGAHLSLLLYPQISNMQMEMQKRAAEAAKGAVAAH